MGTAIASSRSLTCRDDEAQSLRFGLDENLNGDARRDLVRVGGRGGKQTDEREERAREKRAAGDGRRAVEGRRGTMDEGRGTATSAH